VPATVDVSVPLVCMAAYREQHCTGNSSVQGTAVIGGTGTVQGTALYRVRQCTANSSAQKTAVYTVHCTLYTVQEGSPTGEL